MVVKDFRARTAGTGVRHLPKVIARELAAQVIADAHASLGWDADLFRPDVVSLVVVDVNRRPQTFRRKAVLLGQKLPRVMDRVTLEIVAEAEIAQHLEQREVTRRVTDILEIVMLAARAHATLRRRRAHIRSLVEAEEHILELNHPGIGDEQRWVVRGNQRRTGDVRVPLRHEVLDEFAANCGDFHARSLATV